MPAMGNQQDIGANQNTIVASFPEKEYLRFLEYCAASNLVYLHDIQYYDYVAFRTQYQAEAEFVKKIRERVERLLTSDLLEPTQSIESNALDQKQPEETPLTLALEKERHVVAEANMTTPLQRLRLPNRVLHRLMSAGITTVGRLLLTSPEQLKSITFFGSHFIEAIHQECDRFVIGQREKVIRSSDLEPIGYSATVDDSIPEKKANILDDVEIWPHAVLVAARASMELPLKELRLSVRAYNCLARAKLDTVGKVLQATDDELITIRNIGSTIIGEIRAAKEKYILGFMADNPGWTDELIHFGISLPQSRVTQKLPLSPVPKSRFRRLLAGETSVENSTPMTFLNLSFLRKDKIEQASKTIDLLGLDLCNQVLADPIGFENIIQAFQLFITANNTKNKIKELFSKIPDYRRQKTLYPYIRVYNRISNISEQTLTAIFENCKTIGDIDIQANSLAENENPNIIFEFLRWLTTDLFFSINDSLNKAFKDERHKEILLRRTSGETLEEVAQKFDVTRERIRQIEYGITNKINHPLSPVTRYSLLTISADLNGETVMTSDEIRSAFPGSELLIYFLKKDPGNGFKYDATTDIFYMDSEESLHNVFLALENFPKVIFEKDRENLLNQTCKDCGVVRKLVDTVFHAYYSQRGTVWHSGRLSRGDMYGYIIQVYFPNGIHIYSPEDMSRFKIYLREVFGEMGLSENDRAQWGIIQRVCCLYDRGTYIHPSRISIPNDLLTRIEEYFLASGRDSMATHELYEPFADELLARANVKSMYALHGILKLHLGEKYIFYRFGLTTNEDRRVSDEIDVYICKHSPVTKEELKQAFSGISDAMLGQNLDRLPEVILGDNSTYFHATKLKLKDEDYHIRDLLIAFTSEVPVNATRILESLYESHPGFLRRNQIHSAATLFGILQYMFAEEFEFSRPYISSLNAPVGSSRGVLLSVLAEKDTITIERVLLLCEENHIHFPSFATVLNWLRDDYIRIDEFNLAKIGLLQFNDEAREQIQTLLTDSVRIKGYTVINNIDLIFYPEIGFRWTPYLLRSVIETFFTEEFVVVNNPTIRDPGYDLVVDPKLELDNFEDLVRYIVRSEHHRYPFSDFSSVIKWLVDEKLLPPKVIKLDRGNALLNDLSTIQIIERSIPNFLLDKNFMYTDDFGTFIVN